MENLPIIVFVEKENIKIVMELDILVNGKIIKWMDTEYS